MEIGIIGTGHVGAALGRLWAARGHHIVFGSREPGAERVAALVAEIGTLARAGAIHETATAEVIVLATPWDATPAAIAVLGDLGGKIVVDATNPLLPGLAGLEIGTTTSSGEEVARLAPGARVVKGFNTLGAALFSQPVVGGQTASIFLCGDDAAAKAVVTGLASELRFEVVDAGPLRNARWTEALAMLWVDLTHVRGSGTIAFKLLHG